MVGWWISGLVGWEVGRLFVMGRWGGWGVGGQTGVRQGSAVFGVAEGWAYAARLINLSHPNLASATALFEFLNVSRRCSRPFLSRGRERCSYGRFWPHFVELGCGRCVVGWVKMPNVGGGRWEGTNCTRCTKERSKKWPRRCGESTSRS